MTLPPPQPTYVLRGHTAQIHAVRFLRCNTRLLTADADGWVVLWSTASKRAVAVWRAHQGAVLGLGTWGNGDERVVTHGRDNRLLVWQIRAEDEAALSTVLPIEDAATERRAPWLLYSLHVNALNFCAFASCEVASTAAPAAGNGEELAGGGDGEGVDAGEGEGRMLVVAVPGQKEGEVDIRTLPGEARLATIKPPKDLKTGMVMAVHLVTTESKLHLIAGYENGHTAHFSQSQGGGSQWDCTGTYKLHMQPLLSLSPSPTQHCYYTSGADSVIARQPFTWAASACTSTTQTQAYSEPKIVQTKHAGQQSLVVRPDGRVFATAGWDGRVRVYSAKTMAELACLKWHREGVYAVDFAEVLEGDAGAASEIGSEVDASSAGAGAGVAELGRGAGVDAEGAGGGTSEREMQVTGKGARAVTVAQRRNTRAQNTHWLAAGSKDGKVSLWDIY